MNYRAEIDGLRAVAVLSVLLFHAGFSAFAGGFVGVDVFFVISGYLISRGILDDVKRGQFSYLNFYTRRARRILPALIFTVIVTFAAGSLFLSPDGLRTLAKESTHALLSIANIQYWRESYDYFASDHLALLHFWSLSVEEQFYLAWPTFLLIGMKIARPSHLVVATGLASFAAALLYHDRSAVFFLTPFRVFEFAIGAVIATLPARKYSSNFADVLSFLGLVTIVACTVTVTNDSTALLTTLIPCLGAAAIILSGSSTATARGLSTPPLLLIGKASYSIYLIHWPLFFFYNLVLGSAASHLPAQAGIISASLVIGHLMYRYVEQPFRRIRAPDPRILFRFAAVIVTCAAISHSAFLSNGWSWRLSKSQLVQMELMGFGWLPCRTVPDERCAFGDTSSPLGLEMLGDSFAMHYVAALDPFLKKHRVRGEVSEVGGCILLDGLETARDGWKKTQCIAVRDRELARVKSSDAPIIIAQNWVSYTDANVLLDGKPVEQSENRYSAIENGLNRFIEATDRKILIVGAQPMMKHCAFNISRELPSPIAHSPSPHCLPKSRVEAEKDGEEIERVLERIASRWDGRVRVLSPVKFLCEDDCPIYQAGLPLFRDEGHLTVVGSRYAGVRATPLFEWLLSKEQMQP